MSESPPRMADRLQRDYGWTARQKEVLALLAHGRSNTEIAEHLGVSLAGAKWHVAEILSKLQADSREEAAEYWRHYTGVRPRFARVFRGGMALGGWKLAAIAGGMVVAVAGSVLGLAWLFAGDGQRSGEELVEDSAATMEVTSFSAALADCKDCPVETLIEYAPGRLEVTNFVREGENWPHYLLTSEAAFVSMEGERWRAENDGLGGLQLVLDPRFILRGMEDVDVIQGEGRPGTACTVAEGRVSGDRLVPYLPPWMSDSPAFRRFLDGARATVCIESVHHRVAWMQMTFASGEAWPMPVVFIYDTNVDVPATVQSMDPDRIGEFGQQTEQNGQALLDAISRYHDANGRYPAELTPASLGVDFAWPSNPFTGEPVTQAANTPGNFDYRPTADLSAMTFRIDGWDGSQLFYDSVRFGPIPGDDR